MNKGLLLFTFGWIIVITSGSIVSGSVPEVTFSHERGFYYACFELTLRANSADCSIKYTLDGSDPRTSNIAVSGGPTCSVMINPYANSGRAITPGVIVRACAIGLSDTSQLETHSYIFPSEVKRQSGVSPDLVPYWPNENWITCYYPPTLIDWMRSDYQYIDLGTDPEVIALDEYFPDFENDLLDIPTFSLVTDPASLFDADSGIYRNSIWSGIEWERSGSIELIDPSGDGFQSNTGLRIRGGWSCRGDFAKHAFRLFFRKEYGNGKLNYPLFEDYGVDEFDKIDLRCDQNNGWHMPGGNPNADFVHELFARDIQGDMQQPYTRSNYYHLFVNGMYWGVYETQERPEATYAESYLGGTRTDYDVVKSSGPSYDYPPYTLEATDGNLSSSFAFWQIAKEGFNNANYYKVLGLNPDGSPNPSYIKYLDEDNLIDYMIIIYFSANTDGPGELGGGTRINNFFGIFNRQNPDGFKYFLHDAETTFANYQDNITNLTTHSGDDFSGFNPMWLHQRLMANAEYRQKFADRAYKHLFNKGVLTVDQNIERFQARVDQVEEAVVGESARWGDSYSDVSYTKEGTWEPVIRRYLNTYFPNRTNVLIDQFRNNGWLGSIEPPAFNESEFQDNPSGTTTSDGSFSLINPNGSGTLYYTINGADPREKGGIVSADALPYSNEIVVTQTIFLKARVKDGENWSALVERVILSNSEVNLCISEISYNPIQHILGLDTLLSKALEFVEIKNNSGEDIDLSGYQLSEGITFQFPLNTSLKADSLVVVASDSVSFKKLYGFAPYGQFSGSLSNSGEKITLLNASGSKIAVGDYNTDGVWYDAADGSGFTLVYKDYSITQNNGIKENWRVSTNWLGSPGKDDPAFEISTLRFTEVLANTKAPFTDAIEIYNSSVSELNISKYYLSDEKDAPAKWQIPEGTIIPASGYIVFNEGHYAGESMEYTADEFGQAFSLSSAGEKIFMYSSDLAGNVQHFICDFTIEATCENTSLGEHVNSLSQVDYVLLDTLTLGMENGTFKASPLIFKTIMYHPAGNNFEFIILKNRTDSIINLYFEGDTSVTWKIDGINFCFPPAVSVGPGDSLYLIEKIAPVEAFRTALQINPAVQIYCYSGRLKNSGDIISIMKPILVESDTSSPYSWVNLEKVEYDDASPWPAIADGDGYALQRLDEEAFANDATSWGTMLSTLPDADAGVNKRVRLNSSATLDGSHSYDPQGHPLTYQWMLNTKPAESTTQLSENTAMQPQITPDKPGQYALSLSVNNGQTQSTPSYVSLYAYENKRPYALTRISSSIVHLNETITLNGSRSYDPDFEQIFYSWETVNKPETSDAEIASPEAEITTFTPDVIGNYQFHLTVNDGELYSSPWLVSFNVLPALGLNINNLSETIQIYPNPTNGDLFIGIANGTGSSIELSLFDINGREIYLHHFANLSAGSRELLVRMNDLQLEEGLYIIRIQSDSFTRTDKVLYIK